MAVAAILIRIQMGRPVLFRQVRPGLYERPFVCLKFRTMTDERGPDGNLLSEEHRVTPLGRWLRRLSIDEMPQLWNIVRGDLSFVGPRPLLLEYLPYYTTEERRRHHVRPGLTGWAQVHGRNCAQFDERLARDVWYVDHVSLFLDLQILLRTVVMLFTGAGVDPVQNRVSRLDITRAPREP
jgi:sugar transferase EpsL